MLDKATVDLDDIDWHLSDMIQRGISGSEIVQSNLDAERLDLAQDPLHMLHIIDGKALRHFKGQIARINSGLIQHFLNLLDDVILQKLYHRQIDIDLVIRMSHIIPVLASFRCLF